MTEPFIEKNIPLPAKSRKYEFLSKLEVGDSFVLAGITGTQANQRIRYHALKLGFKVATRTIESGARVWRIQ